MSTVFVGSNVAAEYALFLVRTLERAGVADRVVLVHALSDAAYRSGARGGFAQRVVLRLRMYGEYPLRMLWQVLRAPRGSLFLVTSNTFFTPWLVRLLGHWRGHTVTHLLYDLFPEAMIVAAGRPLPEAGAPLALSPVQHAVALCMRRTFLRCDATVFIGDRLRRYAERRYGKVARGAVIAVGSDAALFSQHPPERMPDGTWTVLYSGQLGRMHDWETVFTAWQKDACPGFRFLMRGGGAGMQALEARLDTTTAGVLAEVQVGGSQGTGSWVQALEAAPIGLITLRPGAEAVVFPSKTFSALQAGQAILAIAPEESDLADLVQRHRCGWLVAPGDAAGLVELLAHLRAHPEEVLEARRNAWHAGREYFGAEALARAWKSTLRPAI